MVVIPSSELQIAAVEAGRKQRYRVRLEAGVGAEPIDLPVVVAQGAEPGQTLVALGGVHGDEYEGVRAVQEFFETLEPARMRGAFVGVPVANPPAYFSGTRLSPLDGKNMARVFPGDPAGSATERLADVLATSILRHADFLIDLHSAGTHYWFPPVIGCDARDSAAGTASRQAAEAFGMPVVWAHPNVSPGRTLSVALELGIPWLYTESVGGARLSREEYPYYLRGLGRLAAHLGILPDEPAKAVERRYFIGDGDVDQSVVAGRAGYFSPKVGLLEAVAQGAVVGEILDVFGDVVETVHSPAAGAVMMLRGRPVVESGEPLCVIAQEVPAERLG